MMWRNRKTYLSHEKKPGVILKVFKVPWFIINLETCSSKMNQHQRPRLHLPWQHLQHSIWTWTLCGISLRKIWRTQHNDETAKLVTNIFSLPKILKNVKWNLSLGSDESYCLHLKSTWYIFFWRGKRFYITVMLRIYSIIQIRCTWSILCIKAKK